MVDTSATELPDPTDIANQSAAFRRALTTHPEQMARTIAELHQAVRTEDELVEVLSAAAHLAVRFLPHTDWCSVTTQLDGKPLTSAHTDEQAIAFDEYQYDLDQGPCLQAMRTQQLVALSDAELRERWPDLAAAADSAGIRSFLAAPLSGDPKPRGSLNLYGYAHRTVDEHTRDFLTVLEEFLNHALADYAAEHTAEHQVTQLKEGMRNRAVIEQAKGILMAVHQIPAEEAFGLLRTQSQNHNIKLRDVAVAFVQTHTAHPVTDLTEKAGTGSFSDFHSAFDHAPIGMAITDLDGELLLVNPALATLLGRSVAELVGGRLVDRVAPEHLDGANQSLARLRDGGTKTVRRRSRLLRADGTTVDVLLSAAMVLDGEQRPSHLVVHIEDPAAYS